MLSGASREGLDTNSQVVVPCRKTGDVYAEGLIPCVVEERTQAKRTKRRAGDLGELVSTWTALNSGIAAVENGLESEVILWDALLGLIA